MKVSVYRCMACRQPLGQLHRSKCNSGAQGRRDGEFVIAGTEELRGVVGLICAIFMWQRYCLAQALIEAAVKAFMRTQGFPDLGD